MYVKEFGQAIFFNPCRWYRLADLVDTIMSECEDLHSYVCEILRNSDHVLCVKCVLGDENSALSMFFFPEN